MASSSEKVRAVLLGTALGDALGLPAEGMSPGRIERRFGRVNRFRLLGQTGYVSDDTEQSALIVQSYALARGDVDQTEKFFRRALKWWFLRLPFGIGLSTLKACMLLVFGVKESGRRSAGNGAAMRAAVLGALLPANEEKRAKLGERLARVTHSDVRAVEGALYVANVTARLIEGRSTDEAVASALRRINNSELKGAISEAVSLAEGSRPFAAKIVGNTGFVLHTLSLATFHLLRAKPDILESLADVVAEGGDTDSIAAIVGGWLGASRGMAAIPEIVEQIQDGPFGPSHLSALAKAAARGHSPPSYSGVYAMLRNLALYPVILAHGFRRLLPW